MFLIRFAYWLKNHAMWRPGFEISLCDNKRLQFKFKSCPTLILSLETFWIRSHYSSKHNMYIGAFSEFGRILLHKITCTFNEILYGHIPNTYIRAFRCSDWASEKARLLAIASEETSNWLNVIPVKTCDMKMNSLRIVKGFGPLHSWL